MNRLAILALILPLLAGPLSAQGSDDEPRVWVHAPAEDLLSLFPGKGAGFLISRAEYERLVAEARAGRSERAQRPPLDARVVRGTSSARFEGRATLALESSYVVVVQADRPVAVPFRIEGLALEGIEVAGPGGDPVEAARLVGDALHLPGPGRYSVKARFSARLGVRGERKTAEFRLPAAAAQSVALAVPPGNEGEVGPIARAFATGAEGRTVTGYPDGNGLFRVWLQPRAEARELDPLISAGVGMRAIVGDAGTRLAWQVDLEVLRAPIRRAELSIPKGVQIRGLDGKGIRTWRIVEDPAPGAERDTLEVVFVEPVLDSVTLRLQAERPHGDGDAVAIPIVRVPGAVRFRGGLIVESRPEVRLLELAGEGVRRIDPRGKSMAGAAAVFEVWSRDARVGATVERIASTTRADARVLLSLHEGGKSLHAVLIYDVRGKALFRLDPQVPAGWILRALRLDGAEREHRHDPETGRIRLTFPEGLQPGTHVLAMRLDTDEVDWVPADAAATFALADLRSGLEEESGVVAVESDEAFRVGVASSTGLQPVGLPVVAQQGLPVGERTLYAWRFDAPDWAARFRVERHQAQIGATVVEHVRPRERVMAVEADIRLRIERAGVRELAVALPAGTGPLVDITGDAIQERVAPAEGADPEVWTVKFQRRIRGDYRLRVRFERDFGEDRWTAAVPEIAVPGAQERGFVVIYAPATTAIDVERNGLREADVAELPQPPDRAPLEVLAWAGHPYSVTLTSRRHEPHTVVQAIALSAEITGVFTPDGRLRCRAEYRVRNNDQAFLGFGLPEGSRLLAALVDGEPVKPLVEKGVGRLPLARSRDRMEPFVVAIVYESVVDPVTGRGDVQVGRPQLDIDVLQTTYRLHLPGDYELLDADGTLVPLDEPRRETLLQRMGDLLDGFALASKAPRDAGPVAGSRAVLGAERTVTFFGGQAESAPAPASEPAPRRAESRRLRKEEKALDRLREAEEGLEAELHDDKADARGRYEQDYDAEVADELRPEDSNGVDTTGDFEESAGEDGYSDAPFEGPATNSALGLGGGAGGRREVAHGERRAGGATGRPRGKPGATTPRPERALLSLDLSFLKPSNVVELESLAPDGSVVLVIATRETFSRRRFLGAVVGLFAGLLLLLRGRPALWRVLPATVLLVVALNLAGVSFLPTDFTVGAGLALLAVFAAAVLVRVPRALRAVGRLLSRIRPPRLGRGGAGAGVLLLAALAAPASAQEPDEVLVPYRDRPGEVERVFLPADDYHRLRALADPDEAHRSTAVERARYAATLRGEELTLEASYVFVKETGEPERFPLRLDGVALVEAKLDGEPARLAVKEQGYQLLLAGPGRYRLDLVLRPRLERRGELRSFAVPVLPVPRATLTIDHDRENVDVQAVALGAERDGTWQLGPVGTVGVSWSPETEGYRAAEAELRADTETVVSVRDAFTAVATRVRYAISGGTTDRLRLRVDGDVVVRSVACPGLAGWEVTDEGVLVVALARPASGELAVTVTAERATERERTETAPGIAPLDVLRDAGVLALETLPDLKITITATQGLLRERAEAAPDALSAVPDSRAAIQSVHRYAVRPFRLEYRVALEPTRLRAETSLDVRCERENTWAIATVTTEVERGPGIFELRLALPEGYEVDHVRGDLREWWVEAGTLVLARRERQAGSASYVVRLRRRGTTADPFPAPALRVVDAVRETGVVRLTAVDGRELLASGATNLIPEDVARAGMTPWGPASRAYRFVQTPWALTLATREEPREVEAFVVTRVVPLADRLRVEALVNFHVRRGLVDRIAFTVPVAGEGDALIRAPDLREERSEPVEGGRRFTLMLRTPTRGSASAAVTYHLPYDGPVRGVEPVDTARVERYVAVERVADGMVKLDALENLEPGDFADLPLAPEESTPASVVRVLVGSGGPWSLRVGVQRHTFEGMATALIYRAAATAVVDRTGWTRVAVSYRVYNRSEQFLRVALPGDAELYSVFVAGEGVRPLTEEGWLLIPLRKLALGSPSFDVEVVYAYEGPEVGDRDFAVAVPRVDRIDVRRTTLSLHLPRGFSYDFDDFMDEVGKGDLAEQELQDVWEESKRLTAVAERGSVVQQQRAASNVLALDEELNKLADRVQAASKSREQVQTLQSTLRAAERQRGFNEQVLEQTRQQTAQLGEEVQTEESTVTSWRVNRAWVQGKKSEDLDALETFALKNLNEDLAGNRVAPAQQAQGQVRAGVALDDGGFVPPGMRIPSDPEAPTSPAGPGSGEAPQAGGFFGYFTPAGQPQPQQEAQSGVTLEAGRFLGPGLAGGVRRDQADRGGAEGRTGRPATPAESPPPVDAPTRLFAPDEMARARGRMSIRIDLPEIGEAFHFARLGSEARVEVDASRGREGLWMGLLAIACAVVAWIFLKGRLH